MKLNTYTKSIIMKALKDFINEQLENSNQSPIQEEQNTETTSASIEEAEQTNSEEDTEEKID